MGLNWKKPPWEQGGSITDPPPKKKWTIDVPEIQPLPLSVGAAVFGGLTVLGLGIGAAIGTYLFVGIVTLAGLVALAETNKYVRYIIIKGNKTVDVIIFGASLIATAQLGPTIAASLTVAGLGYTLIYAPWVRQRAAKTNN